MSLAIFSAKGRDSFSTVQQRTLAPHSPTFYSLIPPINADQFIEQALPHTVIAATPRLGFKLSNSILSKLNRLKALIVYSTGLDWIDLNAITTLRIKLYYLEDYCSTTVAEHALGLMLNFSRKLYLSQLKSINAIPQSVSLQGFDLYGKTLGILGLGRIGSKIAQLGAGFGMRIIYHDIQKKTVTYESVEKDQLLAESDIVCLAAPFNGTVLLETADIAQLKQTAYVVNIARKELVNNQAVIAAIKAERVAGYAVDDVITKDRILIDSGQLVQTYHTAWYSNESLNKGMDSWVDKIKKACDEFN